jgi:hypothetical protein
VSEHTLNKSVVQNKEQRRHVISELGSSKELLPNVTDIAHLWMLQAEFPEDERCVKTCHCNRDRDDNPWYHPQDGEGPVTHLSNGK